MMPPRRVLAGVVATLILLAGAGGAAAAPPVPPTPPVPPGGGRVLLEGGWAVPRGNLAEGLDATPQGSGSRPGFELGFRWRFPLTRTLSVAPSFHFGEFGDATGLGADGESSLSPTSLRYGVELLWLSPGEGWRPLFGVTPCIIHNRLQGPGKDHLTVIDDLADVVGVSARVGVQVSGFELSAVYHLNRFTSRRFFATGSEQDYNWDAVVLRIGWLLP